MGGTDGARLDGGAGELDRPMTLQEHLAELRGRLIKGSLGVVAGMIGGLFVAERILGYMQSRVTEADPEGRIVQTNLTEAISVYFKVSLYVGVALAMPLLLYQLIRFLAPGLTGTEKRYVCAMLPFTLVFFALGVAFSSLVAVPNMIRFLLEFSKRLGVANTIRVEDILGFYATLSLWTGLIFEMPLLMFLLASLNVTPYRLLRRSRKYAAVGLMVLAAVITPTPEPTSMLIIWAPMYLLFELGLILARFARPRRQPSGLALLAGALYLGAAPYLRAVRAVRARRQGAGLVV